MLRAVHPIRLLPPSTDPGVIGHLVLCVVLDVDLSSTQIIRELDAVRLAIVTRSIPALIVIDDNIDGRKLNENMRWAGTFGVRNFISRPLDKDEILRAIPPVYDSSAGGKTISQDEMVRRGVAAAHSTLAQILEMPDGANSFSLEAMEANDGLILDTLRNYGINPWMETVRRHHRGTYRHSLLVTGFAVAFSQKLGMHSADQQRIARAALLHDVGKSFIPLSILDKADRLTEGEMTEIRRHPRFGYDLLVQQKEFPEEILDCVLHHHELLDGSGYPDGLKSDEIADLVRIVTITDIFSALVEERPYRRPLPALKAFHVMQGMEKKLDVDLLGAFRAVVEDVA
jgi:putative nucleotidyltransferase with HDIG domain